MEDDIHYDTPHSYEDKIVFAEDAHEELQTRIGVLGGIDADSVARKSSGQDFTRSRAMIEWS